MAASARGASERDRLRSRVTTVSSVSGSASVTLPGGGSGQSSATVSAVSPTKSRLIANSTGSVRSVMSARIAADLTAGRSRSPVSAAIAQPRSGSGVSRRYVPINASLALRDRV